MNAAAPPAGEFALIARHFCRPVALRHATLGAGDDCALLAPLPAGEQLALSSDMLIEGRHFLADVFPETLGHKALAVNLSDLAACGARPLAFTLALALPAADDDWLAAFARGLYALADAHGCELVGGDTTRSAQRAICISIWGSVPTNGALLRSGARAGHDIWVSGTLGDAHAALQLLQTGQRPELLARLAPRLHMPTPRVALGQALRGTASACIDVSDGLCGDLAHILRASGGLGAVLWAQEADGSGLLAATSDALRALAGERQALRCALQGGDDYELLFTAPPQAREAVERAAAASATPVARIGRTQTAQGLHWMDASGRCRPLPASGFDHFAADCAALPTDWQP